MSKQKCNQSWVPMLIYQSKRWELFSVKCGVWILVCLESNTGMLSELTTLASNKELEPKTSLIAGKTGTYKPFHFTGSQEVAVVAEAVKVPLARVLIATAIASPSQESGSN